jgi:hypothetical protein
MSKTSLTWEQTRMWCLQNPGKKALIITNEGGFELIFHPRRELPGSEYFDIQRVELDQEGVPETGDLGRMIEEILNSEVRLQNHESMFVTETAERFAKYGDNTRMSEKQMNWMKAIHKKSQQ